MGRPARIPPTAPTTTRSGASPIRDERHLFELLILEGAQAGLSWSTILRKREGYRAAFADFDVAAVAAFGDADVARLLADPGIVRNRAKVAAAIGNAQATLALYDAADDASSTTCGRSPAGRPSGTRGWRWARSPPRRTPRRR